MNSDPSRTGDAPKSYESILAQQIDSAVGEFQRSSEGLFLSALSAGLDLGFGPLLIAAMVTLTSGVYSEPLVEILTIAAINSGPNPRSSPAESAERKSPSEERWNSPTAESICWARMLS